MTLSTSAAATRRAARRSRRSRRFARRSNQSTTVPTLDKRSNKRRKLRDQASEDIESCFYECQDRGYHDDPDIHIGHEVILNRTCFTHCINLSLMETQTILFQFFNHNLSTLLRISTIPLSNSASSVLGILRRHHYTGTQSRHRSQEPSQ